MSYPSRGQVWLANFEPVVGHEQGSTRPALIVSNNRLNAGLSEMVVAVPITTKNRGIPIHIPITPPDGGLQRPSTILCDQVRAISTQRLLHLIGIVSQATLAQVEDRLRIVLDL